MGPSRARSQISTEDGTNVLLQEKDDRIAALEARLEAYSARASTAQIRLLKTIDVLDALRSQHTLEISAERQTKMKFVNELDRLRIVARNLEAEKDELKDAVEDLIEKVQVSNEWSSWPCSRMYITKHAGNLNVKFAEQVAADANDGGTTKNAYDNDLLAYATSIIARLRTELDFERQSHSKTVEEANLRIEELEAKVAVREAELQNCITFSRDFEHQSEEPLGVSTHVTEKRDISKKLLNPQSLSDEDCLRFLESNRARNRSLEIEIRRIAEKLEQAKIIASTSSGSREESPSPAAQNGHEVVSTFGPRTRSPSVDPNALVDLPGVHDATPAPGTTSPSTMVSIVQLDNQIRAMTAQVDALVSERTTLIEAAARQRRVTDDINVNAFQDILRVEAECVRLQTEVDDLREQLQQAHTFARSREPALLREIARLRASSSSTSAPDPTLDLYHVLSPKLLEDGIAVEESMELASPLLPAVFPTHHDTHTEMDLVLFPFSPEHVSSPAPATPLTPSRTTRQSLVPQDIERVQVALDAARTHLTQKDEELGLLRAETEKHQLKFQAQSPPDDDGDRG